MIILTRKIDSGRALDEFQEHKVLSRMSSYMDCLVKEIIEIWLPLSHSWYPATSMLHLGPSNNSGIENKQKQAFMGVPVKQHEL
jgi:hypothetical protein